jgi:hypothetical protein
MAVSRNDLCPCGSGQKYKKCCLGAPDPKAARRTRILLYASLALALATVLTFVLVGRGVGSAVGMGSFFVVLAFALTGGAPPAVRPGTPKRRRR